MTLSELLIFPLGLSFLICKKEHEGGGLTDFLSSFFKSKVQGFDLDADQLII